MIIVSSHAIILMCDPVILCNILRHLYFRWAMIHPNHPMKSFQIFHLAPLYQLEQDDHLPPDVHINMTIYTHKSPMWYVLPFFVYSTIHILIHHQVLKMWIGSGLLLLDGILLQAYSTWSEHLRFMWEEEEIVGISAWTLHENVPLCGAHRWSKAFKGDLKHCGWSTVHTTIIYQPMHQGCHQHWYVSCRMKIAFIWLVCVFDWKYVTWETKNNHPWDTFTITRVCCSSSMHSIIECSVGNPCTLIYSIIDWIETRVVKEA